MRTQQYLARGIITGRVHQSQDPVVLRGLAINRAEARRDRRRSRDA
ncbi:MAG: hypothetical protein L0H93_01230 [Nocardioides sp.]|nr:hypothetical protein [Nocardioides sp.]